MQWKKAREVLPPKMTPCRPCSTDHYELMAFIGLEFCVPTRTCSTLAYSTTMKPCTHALYFVASFDDIPLACSLLTP